MLTELSEQAAAAGLSLPRFLVESGQRGSAGGQLRQQRWFAEELMVIGRRLAEISTDLVRVADMQDVSGHDDHLYSVLDRHLSTLERVLNLLDELDK
ncbi:hypothetical protein [Saccharopolyspora shandongensis]|uniref:hypothetical protein n=1 Tax=Saccharopolyspora shandongensis TaxID=418495 RepID=UPI0033F0E032